MKRALALIAVLALTACAPSEGPRGRLATRPQPTNPSAVIAAEIAFARLAQEKGQWTAFTQTATNDAVLFVPAAANAKTWLKGRANPSVAVKWQPAEVWMSCDGSYAISTGPWQRPGTTGFFITVWQRQPDGTYKWVLDQGGDLKAPLAEREMIAAQVATCRPLPTVSAVDPGPSPVNGAARDRTLSWTTEIAADGTRRFVGRVWNGSEGVVVLDRTMAP